MILPENKLRNSNLVVVSSSLEDGFFGRKLKTNNQAEITNRNNFFLRLGINPTKVFFLQPSHGSRIQIYKTGQKFSEFFDAVITNEKQVFLGLMTADCVPLVLADLNRGVIALAHIGWRGVVGGLPNKVIKKMSKFFSCDPDDVFAYLAPGIKACSYSQGGLFAIIKAILFLITGNRSGVDIKKNRLFFDLDKSIRKQLLKRGINNNNIEASIFCTACQTDLFPSNFREGDKRKNSIITIAGIKK